ncbi:thiamine-phosphate pyrophosphorylase [Nitratiruptor sp. YY09-18]|uniref:thiamine-phosphate pyrophosphorylase n=1 Tax=Nitratiruptor sp. YY09-18 TaxID=2724901 RepID=UPI001915281B|nr:thiamine-phosphate pyrophosphorylase [Nitratiruptor sp. YY09-18]BCD68914.1 thiamine-phosphate pyrophosphorylase [Nitratiruptor sp. YY09-18]
MKSESSAKLYRLIDANLNRLREGIRVVEDITRYIYDNKELAQRLKDLRHQARYEDPQLLKFRDIQADVLKQSSSSEMERKGIESIMLANIKRTQEAARVLEESLKLIDTKVAQNFKTIRYELYDIEKLLFEK